MTDELSFAEPSASETAAKTPQHEEAADQAEHTPADDAGAQTDEEAEGAEGQEASEGETRKPKKSAKERIDELTWKARDAERRAEEAERRLQEREPKPEPQQQEAEPDPASYEYGETDARYIRDLARYEVRQEFAQQQEQANAANAQREAHLGWERAQAAVAAKYDDYDEVVIEGAAKRRWPCSEAMAQAMMTAGEAGAEIAYHLGSNPAEARRIAALDPVSQIRELGKLEAKLSEPPKAQPKRMTDAPPPPKGIARGAGGQFTVAPDTDDFAAFERHHGGAG